MNLCFQFCDFLKTSAESWWKRRTVEKEKNISLLILIHYHILMNVDRNCKIEFF